MLRSLPNILRVRHPLHRNLLQHRLDRKHPSLPPPLRRLYRWPHLRPWLPQALSPLRLLHDRLRLHDALPLPHLLGSHPHPRLLHRYWRRLFIRPRCLRPPWLLPQASRSRSRYCCRGEFHGWCHLPYRVFPPYQPHWFRMDDSSSRIHGPRHPPPPHPRHEAARETTQGTRSNRQNGIHRRTLLNLRIRLLPRLHRSLQHPLLHLLLRRLYPHLRLQHVLLHRPHPQRSFSIRSYPSQLPFRLHRPHQPPRSGRYHRRYPNPMHDVREVSGWTRRGGCNAGFLHGCFCGPPARLFRHVDQG